MYRNSAGSSVWSVKRTAPSSHSIGWTADPVIWGNKKLLLSWRSSTGLSSFSPSRGGFGTRRARVAGFRRADPSTTLDKSCIQLWPHSTGSGGDRQEFGGAEGRRAVDGPPPWHTRCRPAAGRNSRATHRPLKP